MITFAKAEIACANCGEIITSKHRHDFVVCSCESIFIDGGFDYCRYGHLDSSYKSEIIFIKRNEGRKDDKKRSKRKAG